MLNTFLLEVGAHFSWCLLASVIMDDSTRTAFEFLSKLKKKKKKLIFVLHAMCLPAIYSGTNRFYGCIFIASRVIHWTGELVSKERRFDTCSV